MNTKTIWISILAVLLSFVGGFILANALNKTELETLRTENSRLKEASAESSAESSLADQEIEQKIAEADLNRNDFAFQKNLGISLYRYAAMKKDADLMARIEKILARADELKPNDYDAVVALGHLNFDIGYFKKDDARYEKAREFYRRAAAIKPEDADILTEIGLTYYLPDSPDNERAAAEFQKALTKNPKQERALQFLTQTLIKQGKISEAESVLARLKAISPNTPDLNTIKAQIAQEK